MRQMATEDEWRGYVCGLKRCYSVVEFTDDEWRSMFNASGRRNKALRALADVRERINGMIEAAERESRKQQEEVRA